MNKIRAVCVYCGSSPGNDAAYVEAGERLGSALAAAGVRLIYGGGTTGVMGAVAHGTLSAGGEVGAIIPRFLIDRETTKAALTKFNDVTITETMHERKHKMFERSDAFVALPDGIGTVEDCRDHDVGSTRPTPQADGVRQHQWLLGPHAWDARSFAPCRVHPQRPSDAAHRR